jgi:hypothetical protein
MDQQGLMELAIKSGQYKPPITGQQVDPRTMARGQGEAKQFELILNEMNGLAKEKTLPLQYLQNLKKDLKTLANKAFGSGSNDLGMFYSELSKSVDPAKAISESPKIAEGLKDIAAANKQFSTFLPKYEEALRLHFTKDSQGGFVPNIDKAVTAIRGGNNALLRQMKVADSGLADGDKMLPKIQEFVKQQDMLETQQKGMISLLKSKAKQEQRKLLTASRQTMNNLTREQGQIRFQNKEKMLADTNNFVNQKNAEYEAAIGELNKAEEFYRNQELLRSYRAAGNSPARLIQNVTAPYAGFGMARGVPGSGVAGAVALATSPIISGNAVQAAHKVGTPVYNLLKGLLESPTAKQIVGGQIINQKKK